MSTNKQLILEKLSQMSPDPAEQDVSPWSITTSRIPSSLFNKNKAESLHRKESPKVGNVHIMHRGKSDTLLVSVTKKASNSKYLSGNYITKSIKQVDFHIDEKKKSARLVSSHNNSRMFKLPLLGDRQSRSPSPQMRNMLDI